MLKGFRDFIMRGNVLDLAVAFIIGAAFGKVVTSLVNDIIMPPVGLLLGRINFSNLYVSLNGQTYPNLAAAKTVGAPTINYGVFINTIIEFIIVAFALYLIIQAAAHAQQALSNPKPPNAPTTKECPYCFSTIPFKATRCPDCTSQLTEAKSDGKVPSTGM